MKNITKSGFIFCCIAVLSAGCVKFQRVSLNPSQLYNEFNSRSLDSVGLKNFVEQNTGTTNIVWPPDVWDFELLSLAALYFNPALESARASIKVAESAIITAGARPNPSINPVGGINSTALGQEGVNPWIPSMTVNIPIETANKRAYRIAVASNKTEISKLNVILTSWQIRSNVRSAYIELLDAHYKSNVLRQQLDILEKVRIAMENQLTAGEIKATEITPVLISLANTEIELGEAKRQYDEALPQLAAAIGVPVRELNRIKINLKLNSDTNVFTRILSTNIIELSLKSRADLLSALYEYEAAQAALQLEIARQYPDINISPGYEWDQGEHKWTIGLNIELPVFNRNQGPIAEALANRNLAAAKFNELQIGAISEIESAIAAAKAALEQLNRFSELLKIKENHLKDLETQLNSGAIDALVLEQARVELLSIEKPLTDAYINWEKALARLESALLLPLDQIKQKIK
jgi:outer membrane protein TolC